MGWRQFCQGKCPCIKKRKTAECVCLKCSYLIENIARIHKQRGAWHRAERERVGGGPCICHIHPRIGAAEGAAERVAACQAWEEAERAAMEEGGDGAIERWEAAVAEREMAEVEAAAAAAKEARAHAYDNMFSSIDTLMETLMPCGKVSLSALSIIGAGEFQTYKKRCVFNDCEKRIWRGREACGFESIFGKPCPIEASKTASEWRGWEKRLRGVNEEGKEFHSLEWVPKHGTREGQWGELLPAIKETLPHIWRQELMQQSVRVYEDRKSGRHLDALVKRRQLLTTPSALADAMDVLVQWGERLQTDWQTQVLSYPLPVSGKPTCTSLRLLTLRAVKRLANAAKFPEAAAIEEATQAVATAQGVFDSLSTTVTLQSDYASQLETSREFHATCATKERHNYLVTLMCYGSYKEPRARPRKALPRRRCVQQTPYERPASRIAVAAEPGKRPSSRYPVERDGRETVDYKQHVDVRAD